MKRVILTLTVLVVASGVAFAGNDKPIAVDQLPATAKQLIQSYFQGVKVAYAKMESDLFDKSYEVVFTDGNKVEFNEKGEWKDVDCKFTQVPGGIVPQKIKDYVAANYSQVIITEIDRDKRDYEVRLSNGLELKFDLKYNLIGMDD